MDGEYVKVAMVEAFRRFAAAHPDDFDTPREAQSALWELWRSAAYSNSAGNEAAKQGLRDAWAAVDEPGISAATLRRRRRKAPAHGRVVAQPLPWIDYDPTKVTPTETLFHRQVVFRQSRRCPMSQQPDRHAPIGRLPVVVGHDDTNDADEAREIEEQNAFNDELEAFARTLYPDGLLPWERELMEAEQAE